MHVVRKATSTFLPACCASNQCSVVHAQAEHFKEKVKETVEEVKDRAEFMSENSELSEEDIQDDNIQWEIQVSYCVEKRCILRECACDYGRLSLTATHRLIDAN